MKIKIQTKDKEIKSKNYQEQINITYNDFYKFYIQSLRLSFPDIKMNEIKIINYWINNDLSKDYFSSENIYLLAQELKTSISNLRTFIKPNMIKKGLIVNINNQPASITLNRYLLNENIRKFILYIKDNVNNINNIEIKFDFKIIDNDNN